MKKIILIIIISILSSNVNAKQLSKFPFIPDEIYKKFNDLTKEHKVQTCGFENFNTKWKIINQDLAKKIKEVVDYKGKLSFDKNLKGDFELTKNLLRKNNYNDFIYIGCQILNRNLFKKYKINRFSISEIWNELLKNDKLNGFESFNKFFHLTNLETFKKLKDS